MRGESQPILPSPSASPFSSPSCSRAPQVASDGPRHVPASHGHPSRRVASSSCSRVPDRLPEQVGWQGDRVRGAASSLLGISLCTTALRKRRHYNPSASTVTSSLHGDLQMTPSEFEKIRVIYISSSIRPLGDLLSVGSGLGKMRGNVVPVEHELRNVRIISVRSNGAVQHIVLLVDLQVSPLVPSLKQSSKDQDHHTVAGHEHILGAIIPRKRA